MNGDHRAGPITIEQLTESHRFDEDLAALLTRFQYREDGINLTAAEPRPLPATAYKAPTVGLDAVFAESKSLVFVTYDDRGHQMVNPVESALTQAIVGAVSTDSVPSQSGSASVTSVGDASSVADTSSDSSGADHPRDGTDDMASASTSKPSLGVVTPHNAQRGALETVLPDTVTPNTVEKYQGGERDIVVVCGTVSDPAFARNEEQFILNPNRLLVAISRSRLLTIVVCSDGLFEVAPQTRDNIDNGPVWARLFTETIGETPDPTWAGSLAQFTGEESDEYSTIPVTVYTS